MAEFIGRTGIQWRYLPAGYPPWTAVWSQWLLRANGVWAAAMTPPGGNRPLVPRPGARAQHGHGRRPDREGRPLRPTFHAPGGRGGRTIGTKRTLLVEILGLPVAAAACSARPHDVVAGRELLGDRIDELPRLRAIVGDRAYRGLTRLASCKGLEPDIKAPPPGASSFVPLRPLVQDRARVRTARAVAPAEPLLRGHGSVRPGLARGRLGRLPRLAHRDLIAGTRPTPGETRPRRSPRLPMAASRAGIRRPRAHRFQPARAEQ